MAYEQPTLEQMRAFLISQGVFPQNEVYDDGASMLGQNPDMQQVGFKVPKMPKAQVLTTTKQSPLPISTVPQSSTKSITPTYYHGTVLKDTNRDKGIQSFNYGHPDNLKFFTPSPEFASEYAGTHVPNWEYAHVDEIEGLEPGGTVYPVNIDLGKHWDYATKEGLEEIKNFLRQERDATNPTQHDEYKALKKGYWEDIERNYDFLDYLKNKGYDSISMKENGVKNIGVWNTDNIKSIFGADDIATDSTPIKKALGGLMQKHKSNDMPSPLQYTKIKILKTRKETT